jgi:hypothetical protein
MTYVNVTMRWKWKEDPSFDSVLTHALYIMNSYIATQLFSWKHIITSRNVSTLLPL